MGLFMDQKLQTVLVKFEASDNKTSIIKLHNFRKKNKLRSREIFRQ